MAFEITDLMIQVVTGAPHADNAPSKCEAAVTCKTKVSPTHCADTVTCVGVKPSHCQANHTCPDSPTHCMHKVTCQPAKSSADAELDALLDQLRATLAETAAV